MPEQQTRHGDNSRLDGLFVKVLRTAIRSEKGARRIRGCSCGLKPPDSSRLLAMSFVESRNPRGGVAHVFEPAVDRVGPWLVPGRSK